MRSLLCMVVALMATACLEPDLVRCADGLACPADSLCDDVHHSCASAEQFAACAGVADGSDCLAANTDGGCFDGVCLKRGCANGVIEPGEQCDDRNEHAGDGCSADCRSNETCGNGVIDRDEECDDGGLLSRDGCDSRCLLETTSWRYVPLNMHVDTLYVADDEVRQRLVSPDPTGTWELVDDTWSTTTPTAGALRRPYFDSDRGQVVALVVDGGVSRAFAWDGAAWTVISDAFTDLPGATVYDRKHQAPIMFTQNGPKTLKSGRWIAYSSTPPIPVALAAFDPTQNEVVGFDFSGGETYFDSDVHAAWQTRTPPFNVVDAIGLDGDTLVVVSYVNVYRRTATGWQTLPAENLPYPLGAGAGTNAGIVYRRGGTLVVARGPDRCRRSTGAWTCTSNPSDLSAEIVQGPDHRMRVIAYTSSWDLDTALGPRMDVTPSNFTPLLMAYAGGRSTTVAVGYLGSCGPVCPVDTFELGASGWKPVVTTAEQGDYSGDLIYNPDDREVLRLTSYQSEWVGLPDDAMTWSPRPLPPPPATFQHMAWDARLHHVVGLATAPFVTFVYDQGTDGWQEDDLAPNGDLASDERTGGILLVATNAYGVASGQKVWERRAGVWMAREPLPIAGSTMVSSAYDSAGGRVWILMRLGLRTVAFAHEWSSPTPLETCDSDADLDGDGLARCADPDCYWACSGCPPFATCRFDLPTNP